MKKIWFPVLLLAGGGVLLWAVWNQSGIPGIRGSRATAVSLRTDAKKITENTWHGYKHFFIAGDGRVMRPEDQDTVSEGQAYALLRAVWMGDKETFDRCYRWTEANLSRKTQKGDHLLAWRWREGSVSDWMPASDADLDYALSLVFAFKKWGAAAPLDLEDYGRKAGRVLDDLLRYESRLNEDNRRYLLPWILDPGEPVAGLPQNPSYYSPAHFRVFYAFTGEEKWLELAATSYHVLNSLAREFEGEKGVGLVPDWCRVDRAGNFSKLEGKNPGFGWDAVRIPFRVSLDYFWFQRPEARDFFNLGFSKFIEQEWIKNGAVFCEYGYRGEPVRRYEDALFYAAYALVLKVTGSASGPEILGKARSSIRGDGNLWVYDREDRYFTNSLSWWTEGLNLGIIRIPEAE